MGAPKNNSLSHHFPLDSTMVSSIASAAVPCSPPAAARPRTIAAPDCRASFAVRARTLATREVLQDPDHF